MLLYVYKLVYSTLVIKNLSRLNMPVYGVLDLGSKKIVKVEYTSVWYIRPGF